MEIPQDILRICENACESWKHADNVMKEPYAPMHSWPIKQKEEAMKVLQSHNLIQYNLPDFNEYPLLYNYMKLHKREEERKEEQRLYELTPLYQLKKKEEHLVILDTTIKSNEKNIVYLKQDLKDAEKNLQDLINLYKTKQEELIKLKAELGY